MVYEDTLRDLMSKVKIDEEDNMPYIPPEYPTQAEAGDFIAAAGKKGQGFSDSNITPLLTNVPGHEEEGTVYVPQKVMNAYAPPPRPTDIELTVGEQMAKVKQDLIKNVFGGVDPDKIDHIKIGEDAKNAFFQKNKLRFDEVTPAIYKQGYEVGKQAAEAAKLQKTAMLNAEHQALSMYQQNLMKQITPKTASEYSDFREGFAAKFMAENPNATPAELKMAIADEKQKRDVQKVVKTEGAKVDAQKGLLSKETLENAYNYYKTKGELPPEVLRIFRLPGAQVEIMNYVNKRGSEEGINVSDRAVKQATFKTLEKSLAFQEKQHGSIGNFVRNINKQVDYAETLFDKLSRTDVRALNMPIRELKTRFVGSGMENIYTMFMKEISAEAAKLSQGSSQSIAQLPEGNREDWEKIHDLNLPFKEAIILLRGTKSAANMRLASVTEERDFTRSEMVKLGKTPADSMTDNKKETKENNPVTKTWKQDKNGVWTLGG
jgi:hypothetical protein